MTNRVKLTASTVEALELSDGAKEKFTWDSEVPGFGVRVRPARKTWVVQYRNVEGRTRRMTLGQTGSVSLTKARKTARKRLGEVAANGDPSRERQEARRKERAMVEAALAEYETHLLTRQAANTKHIMSLLRRTFGVRFAGRDLAEITLGDIVDLLEQRERDGYAMDELRRKLRTFLGWAKGTGRVHANMLADFRQPRRTKAQSIARPGRAFTDVELAVVWKAADKSLDTIPGSYVKLLILLGQRRTETARIRWADFDMDRAEWTIPAEETKGGREHWIPLPQAAVAILVDIPKQKGSPYVFAGRGGVPINAWSKLLTQLRDLVATDGVHSFGLHDMRRTFRSGLARLGVSPEVGEMLLNHASRDELAAIYNRHEYQQERREAVERWAAHVLGLTSKDGARKVVPIAAQ